MAISRLQSWHAPRHSFMSHLRLHMQIIVTVIVISSNLTGRKRFRGTGEIWGNLYSISNLFVKNAHKQTLTWNSLARCSSLRLSLLEDIDRRILIWTDQVARGTATTWSFYTSYGAILLLNALNFDSSRPACALRILIKLEAPSVSHDTGNYTLLLVVE